MTKLISIALSLSSILLSSHSTLGFSVSSLTAKQRRSSITTVNNPSNPLSHRTTSTRAPSSSSSQSSSSSLSADTNNTPFATEPVQQIDANNKVFTPGATVAIASTPHKLKAYQVPKAAFGTFSSSSGQFLPQDEGGITRDTSCLVLPEGLRGVVMRVYDVNEWDRTHPILIKFVAGLDREGEGGFDVPKTFMMHFDADEIVVVD
ncbi:predicted protein [Thalassiosira pseudonana CCMP1335]|uniref:Uncharacterized protein n=1 Tax=Thalassiosira pseudonana TaxID=35128 RepID=B8CB85_THAPS|nr:predicted protein [Thalassiosira pseudonana CCMP1335]EED89275.1 predicted protein [Thalassiosira pseudonana CCMP1335]|eukprot:g12974.t1 g12974   contig7:581353-581967(+)